MNLTKLIFLSVLIFGSFDLNSQIIQNFNDVVTYDLSLIPFQKGKLFGYVDQNNKIVIEANFEKASLFNEDGLAQIVQYGLYGIIDKKGREVVPPMASRAIKGQQMSFVNDGEAVILKDVYLIMNSKKKECGVFVNRVTFKMSPIYYDKKLTFKNQMSISYSDNWDNRRFNGLSKKIIKANGKVNFIDTLGQEVFKEDFINASSIHSEAFAFATEAGKIGVVNRQGKNLIPAQYYKIETYGLGDHIGVRGVGNGSYEKPLGLYNYSGEMIFDTLYSKIQYLDDDKYSLTKEGLSGILNSKNEVILDFKYKSLIHFADDLYVITKDYKQYIINEKGEEVSGPYAKLQKYSNINVQTNFENDTTTLIGRNGQPTFQKPGKFTIQEARDDEIIIRANEGFGIYTEKGVELLKAEYQSIKPIDIGRLYLVSNQRDNGLFSKDKKWFSPMGEKKVYFEKAKEGKEPRLKLFFGEEEIVYTGSLKNKEVRKNLDYSHSVSTRDGIARVTLSDGRVFESEVKENVKLKSYKSQVYFIERQSNKKILYDEKMNLISPKGYFLENDLKFGDDIYFIVSSEDRSSGVVDLSGDWMIKPGSHRIRRFTDDLINVTKQNDSYLLNTDFKRITKKTYSSLLKLNKYVIAGTNLEGPFCDLIDFNGNMLVEETYTKPIHYDDSYIVVAKSPNSEIQSCYLDSLGNEKACYPFSNIFMTNDPDIIIAKDVHDFGVVNQKMETLIPFKYKGIGYFEEIESFVLSHGEKQRSVISLDLKSKIEDISGYIRPKRLSDKLSYIQGDKEIYYFDYQGKFLSKFSNDLGKTYPTKKWNAQGVVQFTKGQQMTYVNVYSGIIFQQ